MARNTRSRCSVPYLFKLSYARRSGPLSREGSFQYRARATPATSRGVSSEGPPLTTHNGMWSFYSTPDPHRSPISRLLRHARGCGGPILTRILTGKFPMSNTKVAIYCADFLRTLGVHISTFHHCSSKYLLSLQSRHINTNPYI